MVSAGGYATCACMEWWGTHNEGVGLGICHWSASLEAFKMQYVIGWAEVGEESILRAVQSLL